jgi:hypothetical protein
MVSALPALARHNRLSVLAVAGIEFGIPRFRERNAALLFTAPLILIGCDGAQKGNATLPSRRDSAGIEIVTNRLPTFQRQLELDSFPVRLGDDNAPLDSIVSAFIVGDSLVAVASALEHAIHIFTSDGRRLNRIGRRGRGPGEFESLTAVWPYRGDSLLAFEGGRTRRMTLFSVDGRVGRTWVASGMDSSRRFLVPLGTTQDGHVFARTMTVIVPSPNEHIEAPETEVLEFSADWSSAISRGRFPDSRRFVGPDAKVGELLFSLPTRFAWHGDKLFAATGTGAEIVETSGPGLQRRLIQWTQAAARVGDVDLEREKDIRIRQRRHLLRGAPPEIQTRFIDAGVVALLEAMPRPEFFAVVGAILSDDGGNLWTFGFPRPGSDAASPNIAQVFDSTGLWSASVALPEGLRVLDVTSERLVGVRRDTLGIEMVEVYRLRRS